MKTYVIENKDNERFEVDENELKDFLKQRNLRWSRLKNTWDGWERNDPRRFERGYKIVEVLDDGFAFKRDGVLEIPQDKRLGGGMPESLKTGILTNEEINSIIDSVNTSDEKDDDYKDCFKSINLNRPKPNVYRNALSSGETDPLFSSITVPSGIFNKRLVDNENNILIIGDLHAPYTLKGYLEFCIKMYNKYKCNEVVIIGDIIDNHYSSYHETDPDGYSAGHELEKAKVILKGFYEAFPNAKICLGNHDRIVLRKAFTSGLSKQWIKDMKSVLEVPTWDFKEYFIIDNRLYYHGEGAGVRAKTIEEMMSCIAGHNHSKSYIEFFQNRQGKRIFAMQVGTGINQDSYAFAYNKFGKPSHVNVGIIHEGIPVIEYMEK